VFDWRMPSGEAGPPNACQNSSRDTGIASQEEGRIARPDSDLDFLVIEPTVEHRGQEAIGLRRELRGLGVTADVVVVSAVADFSVHTRVHVG
jgi:hypothetical protein